MPHYVAVPGTWAQEGPEGWSDPGSRFAARLALFGWTPTPARPEPFVWSGDLDGVWWEGRRRHADWRAAGHALAWYLEPVPLEDRILIAHSHGLQAVLYACALRGVRLRGLVSAMSPVRKDMGAVAALARPLIGRWLHLSAGRSDWTQILGELFDGALGAVRRHPLADENVTIPGAGHSGLFTDAKAGPLWACWLADAEAGAAPQGAD